jgi:hypothetical protein
MKNLNILICLLLCALGPLASVRAADQTLAPLPKMTAAEAAETVLGEGVMVRVVDTSPHDVRVGDGETAGGIRIGDGVGWEEGDTLTQDLNLGGNRLTLGSGWELLTLGGWAALSGPGELVDGDGIFRLTVHGNTMLEIISELSAVQILDFSWVDPNFEITIAIGETQPTIMYSTNLISGSWAEAPIDGILTNATTYVFQTAATNYGNYAYFRASIPSGTGNVADFSAEIRENGVAVATTADVAVVQGEVDDLAEAQSVQSNRVTVVEGEVAEVGDQVSEVSNRVTVVEGEVDDLAEAQSVQSNRVTVVEGDVEAVSNRVTVVEGEVDDLAEAQSVQSNRVTVVEVQTNDWNTAYSTSTNNAAEIDALETNVLTDADGVWRASTDQAYVNIGTNRVWIIPESTATDTVFNAVAWSVTETNATLAIGSSTVEVRP